MEQPQKSFWSRAEGKTGMGFLALVGGGAIYWGGPLLLGLFATAISVVGAAITLTILSLILFALIMLITNEKVQTLIAYFFKNAMRKLTGAIVETDPIGIMKMYIEDLKKKGDTMQKSIDRLKAQIKVADSQVKMNEEEYTKQMTLMKVAAEKGVIKTSKVAGRQAVRIDTLNKKTLEPLLRQMQLHLNALLKFKELTETVTEDMQNEVEMKAIQRKAILESHGAMMTAKQILNGGTSQKELFDQAMEYTKNEYFEKISEIESFIDDSQSLVEGLDLQNGVADEEAMRRLQEWESRLSSSTLLDGPAKQTLLTSQYETSSLVHGIGMPAAAAPDYARLIGRDERR